jgi:hypothetical protein
MPVGPVVVIAVVAMVLKGVGVRSWTRSPCPSPRRSERSNGQVQSAGSLRVIAAGRSSSALSGPRKGGLHVHTGGEATLHAFDPVVQSASVATRSNSCGGPGLAAHVDLAPNVVVRLDIEPDTGR